MMDTARLQKINTFVFDVDGVFTDGSVIALQSGEQARMFDTKDGYAVSKAVQLGYEVVIISGGNQQGVKLRLEYLGVRHIFLNIKSKLGILDEFRSERNIGEENVLYMGDDLPDLSIMTRPLVFATCPSDAVEEVKQISQYISPYAGGKRAVRDVIELVLKAQHKWDLLTGSSV